MKKRTINLTSSAFEKAPVLRVCELKKKLFSPASLGVRENPIIILQIGGTSNSKRRMESTGFIALYPSTFAYIYHSCIFFRTRHSSNRIHGLLVVLNPGCLLSAIIFMRLVARYFCCRRSLASRKLIYGYLIRDIGGINSNSINRFNELIYNTDGHVTKQQSTPSRLRGQELAQKMASSILPRDSTTPFADYFEVDHSLASATVSER